MTTQEHPNMTNPQPTNLSAQTADLIAMLSKAAEKKQSGAEKPPTPVEIVRPKFDPATVITELVINILGLLLTGKSVQLWAAKLFGKELTYWEGVRLVSVIRALQRESTHRLWTREPKR